MIKTHSRGVNQNVFAHLFHTYTLCWCIMCECVWDSVNLCAVRLPHSDRCNSWIRIRVAKGANALWVLFAIDAEVLHKYAQHTFKHTHTHTQSKSNKRQTASEWIPLPAALWKVCYRNAQWQQAAGGKHKHGEGGAGRGGRRIRGKSSSVSRSISSVVVCCMSLWLSASNINQFNGTRNQHTHTHRTHRQW